MSQLESYANGDITQDVLIRIFRHLNNEELLKARSVCKLWYSSITNTSSLIRRPIFHVTAAEPNSVEQFRKITSLFRRFRFTGVNLEKEYFSLSQQETFRWFSLKYCIKVEELQFIQSYLPCGRFIELLAFCQQLTSLRLNRSPSLYKVDIGIIHWAFCMKKARANLAQLHQFFISDVKIDEADFFGLTCEMKCLKNLSVCIEENSSRFLPVYSIGEILRRNAENLCCLSLRGMVNPVSCVKNGIFPENLPNLKKLRCFIFQNSRLNGGNVEMLEKFMNKCLALETLYISCSYIDNATLLRVFSKLETLTLSNCQFGVDVFKGADFCKLKKLRICQTDTMTRNTEDAFENLLKNKFSCLKGLGLQLTFGGGQYLKHLSQYEYPVLESLSLCSCVDIAGVSLRHIFQSFTRLTILAITNCSEIVDDSLCNCNCEDSKTLKNLRGLKHLNLSGTYVGNKTIQECIKGSKPNLQKLMLNNTKVDITGIKDLLCEVAYGYIPNLKLVSFQGTGKIKRCEYNELRTITTQVRLFFDMENKYQG